MKKLTPDSTPEEVARIEEAARYLIAAIAMHALASHSTPNDTVASTAETAVELADALLKELQK